MDAISSILFGRKIKHIQFQLNQKGLPLVCILKQFETKNITINLELSIKNLYCLTDLKSINSQFTGKHASTGTSSRSKIMSKLAFIILIFNTFRAGSPLFFLIINFSPTLTAKAGTHGSL